MFAARDEYDIVAGLGEPTAEVASNTACTENRNSHEPIPFRRIINNQRMLNDRARRRNGNLKCGGSPPHAGMLPAISEAAFSR
jgi:hypothetical protein